MSDEELVERTLEGEEDAFSALYERYRRAVYSTTYRILQNQEEALDATQEIFIKVHRALSDWTAGRSKFSTWLYRLASNHAIDCWRGRRRKAESSLEDERVEHLVRRDRLRNAIRSPYRDVEERERTEDVRRCADELPELQKKVFILRYFNELKLEEIADIESCSLGTVKTSLFRGTRAVRRCLRKTWGSAWRSQ